VSDEIPSIEPELQRVPPRALRLYRRSGEGPYADAPWVLNGGVVCARVGTVIAAGILLAFSRENGSGGYAWLAATGVGLLFFSLMRFPNTAVAPDPRRHLIVRLQRGSDATAPE
jgi:hypothetical protein